MRRLRTCATGRPDHAGPPAETPHLDHHDRLVQPEGGVYSLGVSETLMLAARAERIGHSEGQLQVTNTQGARLKSQHDLSLAFFESLYFIGRTPGGSLRVGDLARALRITVGATSKLLDRVEAAGLIRRKLDADDRRASRLALTEAGKQKLASASTTYATELATMLDATLGATEQQQLHTLVRRLLTAVENGES